MVAADLDMHQLILNSETQQNVVSKLSSWQILSIILLCAWRVSATTSFMKSLSGSFRSFQRFCACNSLEKWLSSHVLNPKLLLSAQDPIKSAEEVLQEIDDIIDESEGEDVGGVVAPPSGYIPPHSFRSSTYIGQTLQGRK